jgi:hypothetical protein
MSRRRMNLVRRVAADIDKRLAPEVDLTVTSETEALYRSMPTTTLIYLREGFSADRNTAPAPHTRAFCQGRLDLINRLLEERSRG